MGKHGVGTTGESFRADSAMVPVAAAFLSWAAGTDLATAAHVADDAVRAVVFQRALHVPALRAGGHRLGHGHEAGECQEDTKNTPRHSAAAR